jgi:hypothetical protein
LLIFRSTETHDYPATLRRLTKHVDSSRFQDRYQNFDVAIYTRVYEVLQMADLNWLNERFEVMSRSIKVNKVYLETHRDMIVAPEANVRGAKSYFEERGVKVSGGITITVNERNRFETYCYTNPEHRQKLKDVIA